MVFCNARRGVEYEFKRVVTILILIDGFLQYADWLKVKSYFKVTILILIDGFLQYNLFEIIVFKQKSHNPYFNRWFSAIVRYANHAMP